MGKKPLAMNDVHSHGPKTTHAHWSLDEDDLQVYYQVIASSGVLITSSVSIPVGELVSHMKKHGLIKHDK